jgi:hypothetical protein
LYRSIADRLPIDAAVSEGRRAIANRVQNIEWATPVLYMRAEDGQLFKFDTPTTQQIRRVDLPSPQTPLPGGEGLQRERRKSRFPWVTLAFLVAVAGLVVSALLLVRDNSGGETPTPSPSPTIPLELADLVVTTSRVIPQRPKPGQIFRLTIGIQNAGLSDSGEFEYSWDADADLLNASGGNIANVAPGAQRNFVITYVYGWWGTYRSVINVDISGDVRETDEVRNNRQTIAITVDPAAPFEIDFSLLPPLEPTEPGMLLATDALVDWNMAIGMATEGRPDCADTPIRFVQREDGDMAITPEATGTSAECPTQPLSIELRQPVSNAQAEIIPAANGTATLILYGDLAGQQELFRFTANLQAGVPVLLGEAVGAGARIRRADIVADDQPVTLTRLVFLPVG